MPLASVQLTQKVCTPLALCVEFHVKVALVPLTVSNWFGILVVARGGPPMSTPNLKPLVLPVVPVAFTVTATDPLTVAFATGLTIFTASLSGCTVIVRMGGLGSLTPALSTAVSDAVKVPADEKAIAPGSRTKLVAGFPAGKNHESVDTEPSVSLAVPPNLTA